MIKIPASRPVWNSCRVSKATLSQIFSPLPVSCLNPMTCGDTGEGARAQVLSYSSSKLARLRTVSLALEFLWACPWSCSGLITVTFPLLLNPAAFYFLHKGITQQNTHKSMSFSKPASWGKQSLRDFHWVNHDSLTKLFHVPVMILE